MKIRHLHRTRVTRWQLVLFNIQKSTSTSTACIRRRYWHVGPQRATGALSFYRLQVNFKIKYLVAPSMGPELGISTTSKHTHAASLLPIDSTISWKRCFGREWVFEFKNCKLHRALVRSVVTHGFEAYCVALRDEQVLRVFKIQIVTNFRRIEGDSKEIQPQT